MIYRIILISVLSLTTLSFVALIGGGWVLHHFGRGLPDTKELENYEPKVMTRVHAGDGRLLAEFAIEKRVFVPIGAMPKKVVQAFLGAEDKNFFSHRGIDVKSVIRAILTNVRNIGSGRRLVGASTITQQVAKTFFLSNEVSIARKIKEAILAFRIENTFSKEKILELYLNEIYLGFGSYGVATAALNYFNKSLDKLSIPEAAFLAALPKAPNNYNPISKPVAAKARRDWVIERMLEDGHISQVEAENAMRTQLATFRRDETEFVEAPYFTEEVRRQLYNKYGEVKLYQGGLSIRTTINPELQEIAESTLRNGLEVYDKRHGFKGPLTKVNLSETEDTQEKWLSELLEVQRPIGSKNFLLAVVLGFDTKVAKIGIESGIKGSLPLAELTWARGIEQNGKKGPPIKRVEDVLALGDVILVREIEKSKDEKLYPPSTFTLCQVPEVDGGLVAMNPHTGRVLAMVGGFSYEKSQFNRATQAFRQPGSAFKPFVYLAALESGYTPSTLILDAPFVIDQGPGLPKWRPANYTKKFYGPSTMRLGLEKSRNLMTVRLAQTVGMEKIALTANKFGINEDLPQSLSMSLGAGETTLLQLTAAYAMLANGGKYIVPTFIDRIQDRIGKTIFKQDIRSCNNCTVDEWSNNFLPNVEDNREQVTTASTAFQIVNMLKGVIQRGTGRRVKAVEKPLAGKTGTTNEERDTWFLGFSPDLAVGIFVGFDTPKPMGRRETGSSVPAPIFRDFMELALKREASVPFRVPPGIRLVRVNPRTGRPAKKGAKNTIFEAFKPGTIPSGHGDIIKGYECLRFSSSCNESNAPSSGTGGLY
ncbi:MAG: penicillin-binding protein [Magnetovibrio sp.]|nr:penicillin-binding protein [Magnetovibrio sp.]